MKKVVLLLVLLMLGVFLASACTQQKAGQKPEDFVGGGTPVNQEPQQDVQVEDTNKKEKQTESPAGSGDAGIKEFKITARQFAFEPSTIEVNKGDKVKLIVTSIDVPHGFAISEYKINKMLEPNKPVAIEFTADKQGTFPFFCSIICGTGHISMKGELIVK